MRPDRTPFPPTPAVPAPLPAEPAAAGAPEAAAADAQATVTIEAPGIGVFWSRPKPTDPPFVTVGQAVASGDTIGLLEVMKMFTEIKADRSGRVVEVLSDGSFVEFGQTVATLAEA